MHILWFGVDRVLAIVPLAQQVLKLAGPIVARQAQDDDALVLSIEERLHRLPPQVRTDRERVGTQVV